MIRFAAAFLILFHLCLPLVSCTTAPEEASDNSLPIEEGEESPLPNNAATEGGGGEDEFGTASDEIGGDEQTPAEPAPVAKNEAAKGGEDDLESEFDSEPTEKAEAAPKGGDGLDDELSGGDLEGTPPAKNETVESEPTLDEPATSVPTPEPEKEEKAKVRDIRYVAGANGGTVVIETTKPITYQTRLNPDTQQFVIEMAGVELPGALQRPYLTKDFNSRIGSINAYQSAGSDTARVVIQLNGKAGKEPVVQQEGTSLVVIPPEPAAVAQQPPPEAPKMGGAAKPQSQGALAAKTLDEFLTGNQRFFGRLISLQVKDADVRDVVNFLAEESGANIVMSDDVKGRISLKLRRVPWDQALVTVMRTKELGYVRQGNVLRISTLKALQNETEAANKIIEAQKAIVPAVVQVVPVNYAAIDELVKNLQAFLSKEGKIVADNRTNTLIVTDKAETVDRVQKLVKTLDVPPAQVSIESKIVEASEEFSSFMGVNWSFTGADTPLSNGGGAAGAPINLNMSAHSASLSQDFAGGGPFSGTIGIGTLDVFGDLSATLTLAERDSLAKVISSPRISTMNREKSTILQKGENVSVIKTRSETTGAVTSSEKRTPFSLELNVTPQITSDGAVIMELDVKREFPGAIVDAETQARPINTRQAKTRILVHNGQTAVIGGIYTNDELETQNGIPGLMKIPVLGWLFKNKSTERSKNELLIFLTPRILAQEEAKAQTASAQ
jgi:type IV pilus assembly protein PilQ